MLREGGAVALHSRGLASANPLGGSILGRDEHVADAAHGADGLWMRRVDLDLAAQAGDAQVDGAIERLHLTMGDGFQQPIAAEGAAGVLGQRLQQVELARRQRLFGAAAGVDQHPLLEIERRPMRTRGPAAGVAPVARRSTLFTRASSSRGSNGLAM